MKLPSGVHIRRDLDVDDPRTTELWKQLVRRKGFLKEIYQEWYSDIVSCLPTCDGAVLELGSGSGFLRDQIPDLVTSDILSSSGLCAVLDAHHLPFQSGSLRAVVMTDVIHHLPHVQAFFAEASRCVRPGGRIVMVEPWVTTWSRLIYRYFHPEPIVADAKSWEFDSTGPLSGANSALPWILFSRDREIFIADFPEWCIKTVRPLMPFRYLLSGGLSPMSLMPRAAFDFWRGVEGALEPWMDSLAMFAFIVLERDHS